MQTILLRCPRRARFHFGQVGLGENMALSDTAVLAHSDTLFSAIINTAAVFPDTAMLDELIDAFKEGEVGISSASFCWQVSDSNYIWFLPKPAISNESRQNSSTQIAQSLDTSRRKEFGKVKFLSKGVWESDFTPTDWFDPDKCLILDGKFVVTQTEALNIPEVYRHARTKLYEVVNLPKVRVHAADQQQGFFGQAAVQLGYWDENCRVHYYMLAQMPEDERLAAFFHTVMQLLVDQGIGGERRVGCGQLTEIEWRTDLNELPTEPTALQMSLALLNPESVAELGECLSYETTIRGGRRITVAGEHEVYLDRIRMILEGAISQKALDGRVVNINPYDETPHPFYRLGRHFSISLPQNLMPYVQQ